MDTMSAYARALANRGNRQKVFDWDKAATIIARDGVTEASAGLSDDWEYTGGAILRDGKPVPAEDTYTYLCSNWATPELELMSEGVIDCWRWKDETPGWGAETYWPASALAILRGAA